MTKRVCVRVRLETRRTHAFRGSHLQYCRDLRWAACPSITPPKRTGDCHSSEELQHVLARLHKLISGSLARRE